MKRLWIGLCVVIVIGIVWFGLDRDTTVRNEYLANTGVNVPKLEGSELVLSSIRLLAVSVKDNTAVISFSDNTMSVVKLGQMAHDGRFTLDKITEISVLLRETKSGQVKVLFTEGSERQSLEIKSSAELESTSAEVVIGVR